MSVSEISSSSNLSESSFERVGDLDGRLVDDSNPSPVATTVASSLSSGSERSRSPSSLSIGSIVVFDEVEPTIPNFQCLHEMHAEFNHFRSNESYLRDKFFDKAHEILLTKYVHFENEQADNYFLDVYEKDLDAGKSEEHADIAFWTVTDYNVRNRDGFQKYKALRPQVLFLANEYKKSLGEDPQITNLKSALDFYEKHSKR